ncbi:MAG: sigma factor-like helix-turn-helix DNA-binding protein [Planctomycetota bacterium]|jgi:DNA-directed RNA polymerase specialized sigma subunit
MILKVMTLGRIERKISKGDIAKGKDAAMNSPKNDGNAAKNASEEISSRSVLITEILRELTLRERLVLALRYTEELTITEIAAVMEVAVNEVERMLDSIAERVRRRIAPVYGRPRLA